MSIVIHIILLILLLLYFSMSLVIQHYRGIFIMYNDHRCAVQRKVRQVLVSLHES